MSSPQEPRISLQPRSRSAIGVLPIGRTPSVEPATAATSRPWSAPSWRCTSAATPATESGASRNGWHPGPIRERLWLSSSADRRSQSPLPCALLTSAAPHGSARRSKWPTSPSARSIPAGARAPSRVSRKPATLNSSRLKNRSSVSPLRVISMMSIGQAHESTARSFRSHVCGSRPEVLDTCEQESRPSPLSELTTSVNWA